MKIGPFGQTELFFFFGLVLCSKFLSNPVFDLHRLCLIFSGNNAHFYVE